MLFQILHVLNQNRSRFWISVYHQSQISYSFNSPISIAYPVSSTCSTLTLFESKFAFVSTRFQASRIMIPFIKSYFIATQQKFLNAGFMLFFKKIKFKGKGYYLYKNRRNVVSFRFGYGHRNYRPIPMIGIKVRSKTSFLFWSLNYLELHNRITTIKAVRSINVFTGRGIRFSRQIVYKKTGKISSFR